MRKMTCKEFHAVIRRGLGLIDWVPSFLSRLPSVAEFRAYVSQVERDCPLLDGGFEFLGEVQVAKFFAMEISDLDLLEVCASDPFLREFFPLFLRKQAVFELAGGDISFSQSELLRYERISLAPNPPKGWRTLAQWAEEKGSPLWSPPPYPSAAAAVRSAVLLRGTFIRLLGLFRFVDLYCYTQREQIEKRKAVLALEYAREDLLDSLRDRANALALAAAFFRGEDVLFGG
jgi:hypothetical protein